MSSKQDSKYLRMKVDSLRGIAEKFELDPEVDYFRPSKTAAERAFELAWLGYDIGVVLMQEAFPSVDRRTVKRGRKWTREARRTNGTHSGTFWLRAMATLLARTQGRLDDDAEDSVEPVEDPEFHMSMRHAIEDFFPELTNRSALWNLRPVIDPCDAEFVVIEKGEPRAEVAKGEQPANEYSRALMRGEDPREDSRLLEEQRRYARDFFIHVAALTGFQATGFAPDVASLFPKLIQYLDPDDPKVSDWLRRARATWFQASRPYREYVLLEYRNSSRSGQRRETGTA